MPDNTLSLKRRIEELEEFHRLAQSLSSVVGLFETLEAIANCCLKLCKAEQAAIVLLSPTPDDSAKTVVRSAGASEEGIDHVVNSLVAGWIEHHQKPLLTDNILLELKITNPHSRIRSLGPALAVPLTSEGKTIGIINLVNSQNGPKFSADSLQTASTLAPLATQFILRAKAHESLFEDNRRLKSALRQHYDVESIIGKSPTMTELKAKILRVASTSANVFLSGETGTGKELVAQAIHSHSLRAGKPFIAVNCAAIPATLVESELFGHEKGSFTGATEMKKGTFESAHTGTLFLDEISAMPVELQPKLLRVLEERAFSRVGSSTVIHVDVRLISASNIELSEAIKAGRFREDLYHRLNVVPLHLPPLRERTADIPLLAQSFLQEFSYGTKRFAPDAQEKLSKMSWRGNVRELRNFVERVSIFAPTPDVTAGELRNLAVGEEKQASSQLAGALKELLVSKQNDENVLDIVEKDLLRLAFEQAQGNLTKAAELLGIDRNAFQRRLDKFKLR
ncbi:MAG: sigma-54-dependent Fis family transcriptional regulator [Ignavibacteriales bacterium]|nr:sigma-54-dependent Fis family transcriptional regulator [Ignavibacteriales bacterium]